MAEDDFPEINPLVAVFTLVGFLAFMAILIGGAILVWKNVL